MDTLETVTVRGHGSDARASCRLSGLGWMKMDSAHPILVRIEAAETACPRGEVRRGNAQHARDGELHFAAEIVNVHFNRVLSASSP